MRRTLTFCFPAISFLLFAIAAPAAMGQIKTQRSPHLRILYLTKEHEFIIPHVVRSFENALRMHKRLSGFTPTEQITVLVQQFGDVGNGAATAVPRNFINVGISPFQYTYETIPVVERMSWMMNHELTHIVSMDKTTPSSRFFRTIFQGKVEPIDDAPISMIYSYLTSPRLYAPRWFFEGQAVFMETWMNGGLGRAQGAYDEMVFRTMVRENAYFYDMVGLESEATKVDFQVGAESYLYGTRFLSYLALQYGPQKLLAWNNQTDTSDNGYASQFERVYHAPLDDEWGRWITWERRWQKDNLAAVRRNPITRYRRISEHGLGSASEAFYDRRRKKLYMAVSLPGQFAHIAALDMATGKQTNLVDIRGGALFYVSSLAYDSVSQTIFYSTDNNRLRDIHTYNLRTRASTPLLKNASTGDLAYNYADRSLWGVRHFNGLSSLVRIPWPYTEWNLIHLFGYGEDLFDLAIAPDGSKLAGAIGKLDGSQQLIMMDTLKLLAGEFSPKVLADFENSTPANFVFSADGKHLFGSSFYSGVSNIVRYDVETESTSWLTNCETGLFRPVPVSADSLVAFLFSREGFVPVMIANKTVDTVSAIRYLGTEVIKRFPELQTWQVNLPSASPTPVWPAWVRQSEYSAMKLMSLSSMYPIVEGYKELVGVGMRFNFSDPIYSQTLDVSSSYTPTGSIPDVERVHLGVEFRFWKMSASGYFNKADFYDLFGPTKISRKGLLLNLDYRDYLFVDEPEILSYGVRLGAYWRLERLPEYQSVGVRYDRFYSLSARLSYSYLEKSLGAIEDEKGWSVNVVAPTNFVLGVVFPRFFVDASWGFLLPIDHSSIWVADLGRQGVRAQNRDARQLLFRRVRKQLGGSQSRCSVSRPAGISGNRRERAGINRGDKLRENDAGVGSSSGPLPALRASGFLRHLDTLCPLYVRDSDQCRRSRLPDPVLQRRSSARLSSGTVFLPAVHIVRRVCLCVRRLAHVVTRIHDLAQDPLIDRAPDERSMSRRLIFFEYHVNFVSSAVLCHCRLSSHHVRPASFTHREEDSPHR